MEDGGRACRTEEEEGEADDEEMGRKDEGFDGQGPDEEEEEVDGWGPGEEEEEVDGWGPDEEEEVVDGWEMVEFS